jgi:hypothetical protein
MRIFVITLLLFVGTLGVFAQTLKGSLRTVYGSLSDADTVTFANQKVVLRNLETRRYYKTVTDLEGNYYFDNITPGKYLLLIDDPVIKSRKSVLIEVKAQKETLQVSPIIINRRNKNLVVVD